MGQRANLVVGSARGYELYYTHWRANTLDGDLFWGPDAAIAFARRQVREPNVGGWLDTVWAEGGAVIDLDAHVLLWFGGEDIRYDVPLRRVHAALMEAMWPGWSVRWAYDEILDLARYVGRDTVDLDVPRDEAPPDPIPRAPGHPSWVSSFVSFRSAGGAWKLHAHDLDEAYALAGPDIAAAFAAQPLPDRLDYAALSSSFPMAGTHIDEASRRVDVWAAAARPRFAEALRAAWPGWNVTYHGDAYERVTAIVGERLRLPERTPEALATEVRSLVLRPSRDSSGLAASIAERLAAERGGEGRVEINPYALRDDPAPSPGAEEATRFDRAAAAWLARVRERGEHGREA